MRKTSVRALPGAIAAGLILAGCGRSYTVLHPSGPVARSELHLMVIASIAMAAVVALVLVIFFVVLARFRDVPGRRAPYTPNWSENRFLEILWFAAPALVLVLIAIPTVRLTFGLARIPSAAQSLEIDVTSLTWKWLFEYPGQHLATVNYAVIPTGRPIVFQLTADSPMNAFWVPQLGGMENAMPDMVLPLWLQADRAGVYDGRSSQFSGTGFEAMGFQIKAVDAAEFASWVGQVRRTAPPLTTDGYRRLLDFGTSSPQTYSSFPGGTFPAHPTASLAGSMFQLAHNRPQDNLPRRGAA